MVQYPLAQRAKTGVGLPLRSWADWFMVEQRRFLGAAPYGWQIGHRVRRIDERHIYAPR